MFDEDDEPDIVTQLGKNTRKRTDAASKIQAVFRKNQTRKQTAAAIKQQEAVNTNFKNDVNVQIGQIDNYVSYRDDKYTPESNRGIAITGDISLKSGNKFALRSDLDVENDGRAGVPIVKMSKNDDNNTYVNETYNEMEEPCDGCNNNPKNDVRPGKFVYLKFHKALYDWLKNQNIDNLKSEEKFSV